MQYGLHNDVNSTAFCQRAITVRVTRLLYFVHRAVYRTEHFPPDVGKRRMQNIIRTDHLRNEEVLLQVNEQRNILHSIRKRKANWIGHILRRNCLLKQVIEGKIKGEIEVTRRQGRRRKKLLDDLKDRRGYCHLKEEAVDRNMWRDRFGRGFEPVVRQTAG